MEVPDTGLRGARRQLPEPDPGHAGVGNEPSSAPRRASPLPVNSGAYAMLELQRALEAIDNLRNSGARVHCITNTVAQNFTANLLLACGATPSMTASADEASYFTGRADSLLVNLGTLDRERRSAIEASLEAAQAGRKPFVLDPVMCHVSPPRLEFAIAIAGAGPAILRGNEAEIRAIGEPGAALSGCCIVETGATDAIRADGRTMQVENGDPMLAKVIATGCAQGALMAALLPHVLEPRIAALAALAWMGVAGEIAAATADGPGSFSWMFLDALASVTTGEIGTRARVS